MIKELNIRASRQGLHEFTGEVASLVRESGVNEGLCTVFLSHTSASLTIQENADPSARRDLENWLARLVPENDSLFTHTTEGPDDMPSHVKTALTATSLGIPVVGGRLALGTWQGILSVGAPPSPDDPPNRGAYRSVRRIPVPAPGARLGGACTLNRRPVYHARSFCRPSAMLDVILQSGALILIGVAWRTLRPLGLDGDTLRASLTGVVYVLLLPALVLVVLWRAPLDLAALLISVSAAAGIVVALVSSWVWFGRFQRYPSASIGALVLASAFPNATYLGLPVLEASLGPWARTVAVQYDMFACTPLLLSVGVMIASRFGGAGYQGHPLLALLRVPPLWAAAAGVTLNLSGVPLPDPLGEWLDRLAVSVVPLMLFSLGLGLQWSGGWRRQWAAMPALLVIQLLLMPAVVWGLGGALGLEGDMLTAVTLEAGMPSMVLGVVLCDRYRLDTAMYAMAVTVTTAGAMVSLPLWFEHVA